MQHRSSPPSFAQERLWFLDRLHPDTAFYNVPIALRLAGGLDVRALERALGEVVRRHEALRTTFREMDGAPVQVVMPCADFGLAVKGLSHLPPAERETEVQRLCGEETSRPFDLATGPLFRARLLRLGDEEHVLLLGMHHIISDGWSIGILFRELSALYGAFREGGESPLPEPPIQFADYASWQRERLRDEELERQLTYWTEQLAGAPALLELPTDHPRPAVESHRGASVQAELPGELVERLRALGRREGATLYMVLLAGFQLLLAKYAGVQEVVVGTPVAGRMRLEAEELIGFFANTLALHTDLRGDPSFRELLRRVRAATLGAYDHQEMPFEKLVAELRPERSLGHSPLVQVMFSVDAEQAPELRLAGMAVTRLPMDRPVARFDLSLLVARSETGWSTQAQYRTDLFEPGTIARMLGHLERVLDQAARDADLRLSQLELPGEAERRRLLEEWNPALAEVSTDRCIHRLVEGQAARTPDAVAVVFREHSLTYRQLDERANRLAHHLARCGAGPEARVGLCLERSAETVVAILAVLKAGAAYLPLDPRDPAERLALMAADAGVRMVVTQASLAGALPSGVRVIAVDADAAAIAAEPAEAPGTTVWPENAAYVLYTSGSTGRPKGVVATHAGVASFFAAMDALVGTRPGTWLAVTRTSFDIHVTELLWTLARGCRVVVQPELARAGPDETLAAQISRHAVTHLQCTPSLAAMLVAESGAEALAGLERVLLGGEALPADLAAAFEAVLPGRLLNLYGPTETTVWSTAHVIADMTGSVPIGRPLANTRVYVLDASLRPQPVGVPGELCVAGAGVTRGYLNRPGMTAERFLPDPFSPKPGACLYRTGDRARWRADGTLEFLGRLDAQVKLRGFRIEPGEIETVLRRHLGVSACAVVAREDAPGERRLVAYVAGDVGEEALRAHLRRSLPEHMVPAAFVALDRLPLNANGKLDRAALPAPETARAAAVLPPRDGLEARVAQVWREVLGRTDIGMHDGFFDLGGDSLLLYRVFVRLREMRSDLRVVDLFRHGTVEALARHLGAAENVAAPAANGGPTGNGRHAPSPVLASSRSGDGGYGIAVVGMSCRFPGARSPAELWRNLSTGVESISFFSDAELLEAGVPPDLVRDPAYVRAQGSLADAYAFDADFFGVSPREAEVMDPQHRVFLECAWSALEDAGVDPARSAGAVGVYAGSGTTGHLARVLAAGGGQLAAFGNAKDFLTTRVSYRLGLRGPSVVVQTACSTSLVAIHLACRALLDGECDVALAGGVTIALDQVAGYLHQEGGILSPDGHCRAFDVRAAGTVFGSGAGVVVLKRLVDAVRDGDTIHAVVRGSAVNNDGAGKVGFTAPGVEGQARVIAAALAAAGVDASSVSCVEAHGTGTALGDPVEVAALTEVFRAATDREAFCALGAVKPNLGHLDTAAGVAGFIKTVLALEHCALPPTLHFQEPNPETGLGGGSPFFVNTALRKWEGGGAPRRAGVSSFGFGGTNAHVVLEEAPIAHPSDAADAPQLLILSARSGAALQRMRSDLAAHLAEHPHLPLADVAQTLAEGRAAHRCRWAAACRDVAGAREAVVGRAADRVAREQPPSVAFLFPGQGTQHAGMARGLYASQPIFKKEIDRCAELLAPELGTDLRTALFPTVGDEARADERLRQTRYAQPALFAVEYSLARLWMVWGVRPEAMLGHSIGEYVAACIAGVFSLENALRLVAARGRLMQDVPAGAMLAVPLPERDVRQLLPDRVSLAAVNGPAHCVVAGSLSDVAEMEGVLAGRSVATRRLHTSHAFHSAAMDPVLEAFAAEVRRARPAAPAIPFLSNVTGDWITAAQATDPGYWARHLRETVRFADGAGRLLEDPARVLLEVGPGNTLAAFARRHDDSGDRVVMESLPRAGGEDRSDLSVLEALGTLWTAGVDVDWAAVRGERPRRRTPLPTYPFERTVYRVPAVRTTSPAPVACVAPAPTADDTPPAYVEPAIPTTKPSAVAVRVAGIVAGLLGTDAARLDPTRTFLELGADSLLLMQVSLSVESTFGVKVPFRRLMDGLATIEALAAHLAKELPEPVEAPAPPAGEESALKTIVARQLAIMEQQLELLRGATGQGAGSRRTGSGEWGGSIDRRPEEVAPASSAGHGPHRPVRETLEEGGGFTPRQARYFEDFVRRYTARTRGSKEYAARNRPVLADNRASLNFRLATKELLYPIVGERSQGSRLWDVDGNEYVDFTMGFGVHFFGHRPPFIMEAVEEQLRRGVHLGPQSDLAGPAAALFREVTGKERVTFCNTGSEAVMTAVRIARAVTGRRRIVIFAGSYHGCFDGILARAGGDPRDPRPLPVAPGTPQGMIEDVVVLPYGTPVATEYLQAHGAEIAAVLVEAVQSRNPELHPRDFLHELRALTRRTGMVLVFDEMITGFRLHPAGAQGWYGIDADLATYGKVVGGGFPLGIVAGRAELMDAIDGGAWSYGDDSYPAAGQTFFAGTFCKHPVAMAAACAVLRHLQERGPALYEELHARAERLVAMLRDVLAAERVPMRVLHCGSIFHFRFDPRDRHLDLLFHHLLERGIYVWEGRACFLSTAHTDDDCDRLVDALRESIQALREGGFLPRGPASAESAAGPSFPLTPAQRAIWARARLGGDASRAYHEQIVFGLSGPVQVTALQAALDDVVRHHEALRTVFDPSGETQHVLPMVPVPLRIGDLSHASGNGHGDPLTRAMEEALSGDLDLHAGPLIRLHVHVRGPEHHVLQLVVHHLVADGVSLAILLRDLEIAYTARRDGQVPRLPDAMPFSEYAALLAVEEGSHAEHEAEWLSRFAGALPLVLPYDHHPPDPSPAMRRGAREVRTLGAALTSALRDAARREGCTFFVTLLGGMATVAHRLSGQDDMVMGIASAGRPFPGSGSVVGSCADVLPVRSRLREPRSLGEYLRDVRGWVLDACEHEAFSCARLQEKLQARGGPSLPPLPYLVFNLEPRSSGQGADEAPRFAGLEVEPVAMPALYTKYDVGIDAVESCGELHLLCTYDAGFFERATIARMLEELERELEQLAKGTLP